MAKTRREIEKLKVDWVFDPCWDIEDTEGFEEHREELLQFRKEMEIEWEKQRKMRENKIDEEAEKLGVKGLYRKILQLQEELHRIERLHYY